jgi:hypothetical protein
MKLFFSGCARDCAEDVGANLLALLALGDMPWCDELRVYVAENSSKDDTRKIITQLAKVDSRVIPVLFDDLDEQIPVREARIAFCRDRLLDKISKSESDGLYIPIDLDSGIASSLEGLPFMRACKLVATGICTGVFPSSSPYYYDIYALRHAEWCSGSCLKEYQDAETRSALWNLFALIRYVYSRQKPQSRLQSKGLIQVDSAFGGVGIYSLSKVNESGARYSSLELQRQELKLCEHVVFNTFLSQLFIFPNWVIKAPPEHIEFCLMPTYQKAWRIVHAGLVDLKRLSFSAAKRVTRRILECSDA